MKILLCLMAILVMGQASQYRDLSQYKPMDLFVDPIPGSEKDVPLVDSRIVGGWEANPHEFPWQVGIFMNNSYFCGGSVLNEYNVLTAAHCCDSIATFELVFGAHNIRDTNETNQVRIVTTTATMHENYSSSAIVNDVCVVHTPEAIPLKSGVIEAIELESADPPDSHANEIMLVSGWGKDSDAATSISPILRKTNVTGITNTQCRTYFSNINDGHLCIGTGTNAPQTPGHGTCNGDSGGPLISIGSDGRRVEVGIVSFGSSLGCERRFPAAFARVSYFHKWIIDHMKSP